MQRRILLIFLVAIVVAAMTVFVLPALGHGGPGGPGSGTGVPGPGGPGSGTGGGGPGGPGSGTGTHPDTYTVSQVGSSGNATASCEHGDKVTGGGYSGKQSGVEIKDTFPTSDNAWQVDYRGTPDLTAYAVCLKQ